MLRWLAPFIFLANLAIPQSGASPLRFSNARMYPVAQEPVALSIGDLNGDGWPDVVIAHANVDSDAVGVLLNQGDGTFDHESLYHAGRLPHTMHLGDLRGSGRLCAVTISLYGGGVSLLEGRGDGSLLPARLLPLPLVGMPAFLVDVDGDGHTDLVAMESDRMHVLYGDGTSAFTDDVTVPLGIRPGNATFSDNLNPGMQHPADLNGDGWLDFIITDTSHPLWQVVLGGPNRTFRPLPPQKGHGTITSLTVADFNGDGFPDVAMADRGALHLYKGDGTGRFTEYPAPESPISTWQVVAADIDGDGFIDLVGAAANVMCVWRNRGDGTFEAPQTFPGVSGPWTVTVADLNRDGRPDVVSISSLTNYLVVWYNETHPVRRPMAKLPGDVNGDGVIDRDDVRLLLEAAVGLRPLEGTDRTSCSARATLLLQAVNLLRRLRML